MSSAVRPIESKYTEADFTDYARTGPGTLAGRYMRTFWHPVHIASKLPAGRAIGIKVMNEEFTLYRGQTGTPHIVASRCPHRGALLSIGRVEDDCIRCFYHGWKFDQSGQCTEAPAELPRFAPQIQIRSYPTEEYLGLIFGWFGEGEPPPLPRYPHFEGPGVLDVTSYTRLCNYFNNVDNNVDPAHTPFTHAVSNYVSQGLLGVPEVSGEETDWGIAQYGKRPDGGVRVSHHGQPTILNIQFQPTEEDGNWKELLAWRTPIDDDHHVSFLVNYVQVTGEKADRYRKQMVEREARRDAAEPGHLVAAKVVRGELRIEDTYDHPDYFEIQDHVVQMAQGTIADRSNEKLGRSDILVVLLRRIWTREMRALAEGRPLKQWRRLDSMSPTTGLDHKELESVQG